MQASSLSLMQHMIQVIWAAHLEGKPPKVVPWSLPDLRTPEQITEGEDRKARQAVIRARYRQATRPGAVPDPEYAQRLAQAREEHLRLSAIEPAEEPQDN